MNFTALDFETANRERGSVCQIGLATYENGSIIDSKSWLVKPYNGYFDDINTHIHGITNEDVIDSPTFDQIWDEFYPYLNNSLVVAHNASFDISVLRHVLDVYSLQYPTLDYLCSYLVAKNIWGDLLSYKLSYLANIFDIQLNHHDALSDAVACGEILLKGFEQLNASDFDDFKSKLRLDTGSVYERNYSTPSIRKSADEDLNIEVHKSFDTENPFKDRTVVFTGALGFLTRKKAKQLVKAFGGDTKTTVSKKVDILVVGETDIQKYGEGYNTNKLEKAESLLKKGHSIELFGENEFLSFCHWAENEVSIHEPKKSAKENKEKSKTYNPAHPLDIYALKLVGADIKDEISSEDAEKLIDDFKKDPAKKKRLQEFYSRDVFFEDLFEYAMSDMEFYDVNKITYNKVIAVGLKLLEEGYSDDEILYEMDLFFNRYKMHVLQ